MGRKGGTNCGEEEDAVWTEGGVDVVGCEEEELCGEGVEG